MFQKILFIISFAISGVTYANTPEILVGTTPGGFDVSQTGAATFNVPIDVPPGIAGMQPDLSFSYSNQGGGHDKMGVGWNLSGISKITRCPANKDLDGYVSGVNFDDRDRFCLDGQRLVAVETAPGVKGNYGAEGTQYRTEIESFSRVTSYGSMPGGGPKGFIVETKAGLKMYFGCLDVLRDCNSLGNSIYEHEPTETVFYWPINRIEDTVGNYIDFQYGFNTINHDFYPTKILYTGNASNSPQRVIEFEYDVSTIGSKRSYVSGFFIWNARKLKKLQTYLNYNQTTNTSSNLIKEYILNYETSPLTKQSRLESIQECGLSAEGAQECFNPTHFTYQDEAEGFDTQNFNLSEHEVPITTSSGTNDLASKNIGFYTPDINGDGLADYCYRDSRDTSTLGITCKLTTSYGFARGPSIYTNICYNGDTGNGGCNDAANHRNIQFLDINADGKTDLIYPGDEGVQVWISNGSGYESRQQSNICSTSECSGFSGYGKLYFAELNGDVYPDICYRTNSDGVVCYYNTGSDATELNARWNIANKVTTGICAADCDTHISRNTLRLMDFNNDGYTDIAYHNNTSGFRAYLFDAPNETFTPLAEQSLCTSGSNECNDYNFYYADINGDGYVDICYRTDTEGITCHNNRGRSQNGLWNISSTTNTSTATMICADKTINGENNLNYNTDYGTCDGEDNYSSIHFADYNLDGKSDLAVRMDEGLKVFYSKTTYATASGYLTTSICSDSDTGTYGNCASDDNFYVSNIRPLDFNADGKLDLAYYNQNNLSSSKVNVVGLEGKSSYPDLLSSVTNAFGVETNIQYSSLIPGTSFAPTTYFEDIPGNSTWPDYPNDTLNEPGFFPVKFAPFYVVDSFDTSNGVGGITQIDYNYYRAFRHIKRGFVGFEFVTQNSHDNKIEKRQRYHQIQKELQGHLVEEIEFRNPTSVVRVPYTAAETEWAIAQSDADRPFPYISKSISKNFVITSEPPYGYTYVQSSGYHQDSAVVTENTGVDIYGNITNSTIKVIDGFFANHNPSEGDIRSTKTIINTYYDTDEGSTYAGNWLLGRLKKTTATQTFRGSTEAKPLTTEFEYYETTGLLKKEIVEPGDSTYLKLTTTYGYDIWGNKETVTVSGQSRAWNPTTESLAAPANEDRTITTKYTTDGYFPHEVTNASDHTETHIYDARFGVLTSLEGPNKRTTSWKYDSLGRKIREDRHDNTYTTWTTKYCTDTGTSCETGELYESSTLVKSTTDLNKDGAPPTTVWYDILARDVRSQTQGLNGDTINKRSVYDQHARLARFTKPYKANSEGIDEAKYWVCYSYDELGRIVAESIPSIAECDTKKTVERVYQKYFDGNAQTTLTTSKVYNYKSDGGEEIQERKEYHDPKGRLFKVKDAYGNTIDYTYDHFGNLATTSFTASGSTSAAYSTITTHDLRGRKTYINDPNMGEWFYEYNAFGELQRQVDALSNEIVMAYDKSGRMTHRADNDGGSSPTVTTWSYDPLNAVGQLDTVSTLVEGYSRTHVYNSLGLVEEVSTTILNSKFPYVVNTTYDAFSRVETITYPKTIVDPETDQEHADYPRLQTKNVYNSIGILTDIKNAANDASYWTLADINAQGNVTSETLGNGVINSKGYDPAYDFVTSIGATKGTSTLQQLTYKYDSIGNLRERKDSRDANNILKENFTYDKLNRLCNTSLNGTLTSEYRYDGMGNITYKSGVGYYHYDRVNGAGHHAVSSISATGSLNADDCGDALSHTATPGDLNGDGQFTGLDYDLIANSILNNGVGAPDGADCLADGAINVLDGVCVTKKIANAGNSINSTGNYRNYLTNYHYNANGAMTSGAGRDFSYTAFNKVYSVESGVNYSTFAYNPERMRIVQTSDKGMTVYLDPSRTGGKLFEIEYNNETGTTFKHYIGNMLAVYEVNDAALNVTSKTQYFLKDHLGSIDVITNTLGSVITDESGKEVGRLSFGAFGERRNADTWQGQPEVGSTQLTNQGYTGHEHLDNVGIIHMNGRLYDPILGRFLSADPNIQAPKNTQNLNRYSYVLNNPLSFTDPSGYFFKKLKKFWKKYWRTIVAIAVVAFMPYLAPALGTFGTFLANPVVTGFISGMISSGGDLKAGVLAGISAGIFSGIGTMAQAGKLSAGQRIFAHGVAGGVMSSAQGGKFKHGFISGMATQAFFQTADKNGWTTTNVRSAGDYAKNAFVAAVVGGTSSRIGGGKFANGAVTGAFSRFLNDIAHEHGRNDMTKRRYRPEVYDIEDLDIWYQQNRGIISGGLGNASSFASGLTPGCALASAGALLCAGTMTGLAYGTKALSLATRPNQVLLPEQLAVTVDLSISVVNPALGILEPVQTTMKVIDTVKNQPKQLIRTRGMRKFSEN